MRLCQVCAEVAQFKVYVGESNKPFIGCSEHANDFRKAAEKLGAKVTTKLANEA